MTELYHIKIGGVFLELSKMVYEKNIMRKAKIGNPQHHPKWELKTITTFFHAFWRCTWRHRLSLCVAGVALGDNNLHFVWQVWHLWHWAGSGGAWVPYHLTLLLPRLFVWQASHLETSTFTLRGRCGTWWHRPSLCVAGVALGDINLHIVWQAWHLWYWAASCVAFQCMFLLGRYLRQILSREVLLIVREGHIVSKISKN